MELVVALAVGIGIVAIKLFAAHRARGGNMRWVYVLFAPVALLMLYGFWPSAELWSRSPVLATIDLLVGVITLSLLVFLARKIATTPSQDFLSNPPRELFDFFIWGALGVPLILGLMLLVMLATGGLAKST